MDAKRLIFLRHGKVDLPYTSHDDMPFDILRALGTQELDPPSDAAYLKSRADYLRSILEEFQFSAAFRSPSLRCITLENYLRSLAPESKPLPLAAELDGLQEIRFDMERMFPSGEASVKDIAPKLIKELLSEGPGVEPKKEIFRRCANAMNRMPLSGDVLILTHGFLMRFIASVEGELSQDDKLTLAAWEAAPRLGYLEGFVMTSNQPVRYLSTQ